MDSNQITCKCGQPAKVGRKSCPSCLSEAVDANRQRGLRFLAQGLCRLCGRPKRAERSMCDYHLEAIRVRAIERNKERASAGVCRQCAKPTAFGQRFCLVHRRVTEGSTLLPQPVAKALRELRERNQQAARDKECLKSREFIERHIHLIANERTREILRLRYGYTKQECLTLDEVGAWFGITRERVRQIQTFAEVRIHMFTIEKNIPLPNRTGKGARYELKQTLEAMDVGDSFLIPNGGYNTSMLCELSKTLGYVIATRKASDTERRVWLVSKGSNNGNGQS